MKKYIRSSSLSKQQVISELRSYAGTVLEEAASKAIEYIEEGILQSFEWVDLTNGFDVAETVVDKLTDKIGAIPKVELFLDNSHVYRVCIYHPFDFWVNVCSDEGVRPVDWIVMKYLTEYRKHCKQSYKWLKEQYSEYKNMTPDEFAEYELARTWGFYEIVNQDKLCDYIISILPGSRKKR